MELMPDPDRLPPYPYKDQGTWNLMRHGVGETCGLLSALDVEPKTTRDDPPCPDAEPERARLRSLSTFCFSSVQTCQI